MLLALHLQTFGVASAVPAGGAGIEEHSQSIVSLCLLSGAIGGALHAIAMAMKKYWGDGVDRYWLERKWWIGFFTDLLGGLMIWPAMPIVSVQVLMPLVVVVQTLSSFGIGVFFFKESATKRSTAGVVCGIVGVIGLSLAETMAATQFTVANYWRQWLRQEMLISLAVSAVFVGVTMVSKSSTLWAVIAGFLEGIQFITSRALADAAMEGYWFAGGFEGGTCWGIAALKACCVVGIIHTSQLGISTDLSRFAAKYLVASSIFICWFGAAYFGDHVDMTMAFFLSVLSTLIGIWLLSENVDVASSDDGDTAVPGGALGEKAA